MHEIVVQTTKSQEFVDITSLLTQYITQEKIREGTLLVYVPHTTAGITINENADADVVRDILFGLDRSVPDLGFRHVEGNSAAHIKSSLMGFSTQLIVHQSRLELGQWQSVYFCEFDGPRKRKVLLQANPVAYSSS